jgi:S1-C subfamily serine protease
LVTVLAIMLAHPGSLTASTPNEDIANSLVKIYTISNPPDQDSPWQRSGTVESSGSGVIINDHQILTAAHVVEHEMSVEVKRFGSTQRYPAAVSFLGDECDLALLTVSDPEFFSDVELLPRGGLPSLQQRVDVYGFPVGGETISVSSGVVSRVEVSTYSHSFDDLLALQIDAAVNSGNSGGPVLSEGKLVGIAMQTLEDSENIGYAVPMPIIEHFLKDVEDEQVDGFPHLGAEYQPLENPSLRHHLGLKKGQTGVLINRIDFGMSAWDNLQPGDVILEIDGKQVANDMTIPLRGNERVILDHAVHVRQVGEKVPVRVLRDGKVVSNEIALSNTPYLVPGRDKNQEPSYLVFGGLVFQPLTLPLLFSREYGSEAMWNYTFPQNLATPDRQEVVLLTKVLAAPLNTGYHDWSDLVVTSINGMTPRTMQHLAQIIDSADGEWLEIHTEDGSFCVLSMQEARAAHADILRRYGISEDRSADLRQLMGLLTK